MNEIAEIMGAVTNCAVAGIQAGRDIGKAERDKLERQRDEAIKLREDELAEFNEGVKDYGRGVSYDDLEGGAHDVKAVGYAWAAFDDLRKERDEAVRLIEEEALEFIEGQEDVADGDDGRPRPNRAMQIAQELRQFLATLDRTEKT
jgi:hypothetical protein